MRGRGPVRRSRSACGNTEGCAASWIGLGRELVGDGEGEGGAFGGVGFDPDFSAVTFDNALADGQADADAAAGGFCALEDLEDSVLMMRVDADAVVADGECPGARALDGGDVDAQRLGGAVF